MRRELRMKYAETVYKRYRKATKPSKTKILDELCPCLWIQPKIRYLQA